MKKNLLKFAVILMMSLNFISCEKDPEEIPDEPENPDQPQVEVLFQLNEKAVDLAAEGGDAKVTYRLENPIEGVQVKAETSSEWITDLSTATANEITFHVAANENTQPRSAAVEVVYGEIQTSFTVNQAAAEKLEPTESCTVMLYGCGGENLDDFIIKNLGNAEKFGATDMVKMTALIKYSKDHPKNQGTIFYDLQSDGFHTQIVDGKDYDLADPGHLADFIKKSTELYPADKYVLILTDHGLEWSNRYDKKSSGISQNAMIIDDNTGTVMSIYSLADGIRQSGKHFELIYPDICFFGMLEFMNEVEDLADYLLCTSNQVLGSGGSYYDLLKNLNTPASTEEQLKQYVNDTMDFWVSELHGQKFPLDISLIDLSRLSGVYDPIIKFKNRFLEVQQNPDLKVVYTRLMNAQNNFYFFDHLPGDPFIAHTDVDVLDAFLRISEATDDAVFTECYNELNEAFQNMVLASRDKYYAQDVILGKGYSHGIQWNVMGTYESEGYDEGYGQCRFNQATSWSEFLKANVD